MLYLEKNILLREKDIRKAGNVCVEDFKSYALDEYDKHEVQIQSRLTTQSGAHAMWYHAWRASHCTCKEGNEKYSHKFCTFSLRKSNTDLTYI